MSRRLRVLYSFPQKLGADRICYTAWQQVNGLAAAGADVRVLTGVLHRPVADGVDARQTLAWKKIRISYRAVGNRRALALHDAVTARRLRQMRGEVDLVHAWPLAARRTLAAARELGIASVIERPNAHTRYAFTTVADECERLGISLPPGTEHEWDADVLRAEEEEYELSDFLLCPSDFVVRTFLEEGYPEAKLLRHSYGYDPDKWYPEDRTEVSPRGPTMIFAGYAAVRKGLHIALRAWRDSAMSRTGRFLVAGEILPAYRATIDDLLSHPSVEVLGHRRDLPELMRRSDLFVLPSVEEGSPLVCIEAMASGAVPLVSEAAAGECRHLENALIHPIGDAQTLAGHIDLLGSDPDLLRSLRANSLESARHLTWDDAGETLLAAYREALAGRAHPVHA